MNHDLYNLKHDLSLNSIEKVSRRVEYGSERLWAAENGEEHELHHPSDGFLAALDRLAEVLDLPRVSTKARLKAFRSGGPRLRWPTSWPGGVERQLRVALEVTSAGINLEKLRNWMEFDFWRSVTARFMTEDGNNLPSGSSWAVVTWQKPL